MCGTDTAETVGSTCSALAELRRCVLGVQDKVIANAALEAIGSHGGIADQTVAKIAGYALIGGHRIIVKDVKGIVALDALSLVGRIANHTVFCFACDTVALL